VQRDACFQHAIYQGGLLYLVFWTYSMASFSLMCLANNLATEASFVWNVRSILNSINSQHVPERSAMTYLVAFAARRPAAVMMSVCGHPTFLEAIDAAAARFDLNPYLRRYPGKFSRVRGVSHSLVSTKDVSILIISLSPCENRSIITGRKDLRCVGLPAPQGSNLVEIALCAAQDNRRVNDCRTFQLPC